MPKLVSQSKTSAAEKLVADPNVTVGTIYLAFFALNSNFVHNDGGYILESLDYNYNGLNVIVNTPIAGGIDFRNAIANAIGVAVGGTSFGTTPIIETEYPVIQLTNNTDGEVRCIAVNGLTPMQVPKRLYIKRPANPDVEIRIVFNLFINR